MVRGPARAASLLLFASLLLTAGCSDVPAAEISVTLQTDYVPGYEFRRVRTTLLNDPEAVVVGSGVHDATAGEDFIVGVGVAELALVAAGDARLLTQLYDTHGSLVAERLSLAEIAEGGGRVTVLVTRDCAPVDCRAAGEGTPLSECFAGRCVTSWCTGEYPDACGEAVCGGDGECPAAATCSTGRCVAGGCFLAADSSLCEVGHYCNPEVGCVPAAGTDGGMDAGSDGGMDAGSDGAMDASDATIDATVDAPDASRDAEPMDARPDGMEAGADATADAAPSDAAPSDAALDAAFDAAPDADAAPSDAAPSDAAPSDAAPSDAALDASFDAAPDADAAPSDAAPDTSP